MLRWGVLVLVVLVVAREECWLAELVGAHLLEPGSSGVVLRSSCGATEEKQLVVLAFGSSLCEACLQFSPLLDRLGKRVSVVFVSRDPNQRRFERSLSHLPSLWAVPYDAPARILLNDRYGRPSVPALFVLHSNSNDNVLDPHGYYTVLHRGVEGAVEYWNQLASGTTQLIDHQRLVQTQQAVVTGSFAKLQPANSE